MIKSCRIHRNFTDCPAPIHRFSGASMVNLHSCERLRTHERTTGTNSVVAGLGRILEIDKWRMKTPPFNSSLCVSGT